MSAIYMMNHYSSELASGADDPASHSAPPAPFLFPFIISAAPEEHCHDVDHHHRHHQLMQHVVAQKEFDERMLNGARDVPLPFPMHGQTPAAPTEWIPSAPEAAKVKIVKRIVRDTAAVAVKKPRRRSTAFAGDHCDGPRAVVGDVAGAVIRVCSDCNTTKTPLWRSGPCGPKSLCNACGIRQRKARRALAAVAGGGGAAAGSNDQHKPKKEKKSPVAAVVDRSLPFKKRCKMTFSASAEAAAAPPSTPTTPPPKHAAEVKAEKPFVLDVDVVADASVARGKITAPPPAFGGHRAFPQDETDAAILLMTLSCGLVSG